MALQGDVLTIVTHMLQNAHGYDSDEISDEQKKALDYYFMRPRGDEIAGRSQVQSGDLSAMVEANLAQMLDAFQGEHIAEFQPDGVDDEEQCQLETDVVAHYVWKANNGFLTFVSGIKDALLMRNAIGKVWIEEHPIVQTRDYVNVEPEAFAEITSAPDTDVDVVAYDPEERTLTTRETKLNRELKIDAVPIENIRYTKNWHSLDLQRIPFFAERHVDSRSEMIDKGFSATIVNRLPTHVMGSTASDARNPRSSPTSPNPTLGDPSLEEVEWYEAYVLLDVDGDGRAERRRIDFVENSEILSNEEEPFVPYPAGSALVNAHRFLGISLYDKLKQVQDIGTALKRAVMDNANAINKSRLGYLDGKVDPDALASGEINADIPVKPSVGSVSHAIMPIHVPDITAGIQANIEANKRDRAELGGAALDLAQGQAQLSERIGSQGVDRIYSVMEQLAGMMTRTVAETFLRSVYLLTHATLRRFFDRPVSIKRNGEWQQIVPADWPARTRLEVKPGMSPGQRKRVGAALGEVMNMQLQLAERGQENVLVDAASFYRAFLDWARANEIQNAEQYLLDPRGDGPRQELEARARAAAADKAAQQNLMDMALGLEQLRVALDKRNADADRVLEYFKAVLSSEVEEAKIVGEATAELQQTQLEADMATEARDADMSAVSKIEAAIDKLKSLDGSSAAN